MDGMGLSRCQFVARWVKPVVSTGVATGFPEKLRLADDMDLFDTTEN